VFILKATLGLIHSEQTTQNVLKKTSTLCYPLFICKTCIVKSKKESSDRFIHIFYFILLKKKKRYEKEQKEDKLNICPFTLITVNRMLYNTVQTEYNVGEL